MSVAPSLVELLADASSSSALQPGGVRAGRDAALWWAMFGISVFVFVLVCGLLAYGLFRRRTATDEGPDTDERGGLWLVIAGGIVFPFVVLAVLIVVVFSALGSQAAEQDGAHGLTIQIVAHQWWWEIRYPSAGFTTANEIHIPVGVPVDVEVTTDDVIHSVWVPELGGKIDTIPGRTNSITWEATREGTFRGECAEYCGLEHAEMQMLVVAQSQSDYDAWVADQQRAPATPSDPRATLGQHVFTSVGCADCHTISGVSSGTVGPDLTHVASRTTLAAGWITNTIGNLQGWIANPQSIKPGNHMPALPLSARQARAVASYLETLR